jgi:hypothetical protein
MFMPRIKPKKEKTPEMEAKKMDILIGADPELFAIDSSGQPVSVHDLLPGNKAMPVKVPFGGIQVDGIAAEFNIEPAKSRTEFLTNIAHVQNILTFMLKQKRSDLTLTARPTVFLSQKYMSSLPAHTRALGCEPDYNVYTRDMNPKPSAGALFRTGSGHVHIGWTEDVDPFEENHFNLCCELGKEYDFVLYQASQQWDKDTTRSQLYGQPGAFRPKSYGMEYRVLSNAWLRQPLLQQYVYDATRSVTELFFKGIRPSVQFGKEPKENYSKYFEMLDQLHIPNINNYAFSAH